MKLIVNCLTGLLIAAASPAAWASNLTLPADAELRYAGESDLGACTIQIATDALARPLSVRLDLLDAAPGNIQSLDLAFSYLPLPGFATLTPTTDGYSVSKTMLTSGMVEINTAAFSGSEQGLAAVTVTRNFVNVLGVTVRCAQLQAL